MPLFLVAATLESAPTKEFLFLVEAPYFHDADDATRAWLRTHETITRMDGAEVVSRNIAWLGLKDPHPVKPGPRIDRSFLIDGRAL